MKVHTEVHCGDTKRNPKFQVNTFIHYQDMEFLNFSVFLTVRLYFPTNCFQILTALGLESDKLRTVGIFSISQLDLYTKEEFLFNSVLTVYGLFSTFLHLQICQKSCKEDRPVLFFSLKAETQGFLYMLI